MVLISLRDPIARCFSQYRYAFNNHTEAFRDAAEQSTGIMRRCYDKHLAGTDLRTILDEPGKATALAKEINYCLSPMLRTQSRRAILSSLYLPQLLSWVDTFGKAKVKVVTKEALESDPQAAMDDIYRFLGLCTYEGSNDLTAENVRDLSVPAGYDLTEQSMLSLAEAFQPWNKALYDFLQRDLGWPTLDEAFVQAKLKFHRAVLFTAATPCEACDKAAELLASYNLSPKDIEVVAVNGASMGVMAHVDALAGGPKDKSPPYVFVDGAYIGGWPQVQRHHQAKELAAIVAARKSVASS